jgi:hypothetical protein
MIDRPATAERIADAGIDGRSRPQVSPRTPRCSRSSRRSASATSVPSTVTTTATSRRRCGTRPSRRDRSCARADPEGQGLRAAETDREKKLHDTSAFDIATGRGPGSKPRVVDAGVLRRARRLWTSATSVVAMTAAMPGSTGLLPDRRAPPRPRVIDVGIAEQHMVTSAAGIAHEGARPRRRGLLDLLLACVRPGQHGRRAARRARRLRLRPRRHHRRRRPVHHGDPRHEPVPEDPDHDGARPVVGCRAAPDRARAPVAGWRRGTGQVRSVSGSGWLQVQWQSRCGVGVGRGGWWVARRSRSGRAG